MNLCPTIENEKAGTRSAPRRHRGSLRFSVFLRDSVIAEGDSVFPNLFLKEI